MMQRAFSLLFVAWIGFTCILGASAGATVGFDPSLVGPGDKAWGYIPVTNTLAANVDMPVMVINGAQDGPTFTITAGLYPTEYCGVEAAGRLYKSVDPKELRGRLVIIPVANMPVLQFRTPMFQLTSSISPMDGKMLASVFPGASNGSITEVIASRVFDFVLNSSYHVDLRGGDLPESHLTHTIFVQGAGGGPGGGPNMDATTRAMGTLFGTHYCRESRPDIFDTKPGSLIFEAVSRGVPSIISEAGRGFDTQPTEEDVQAHVVGVTNLLRWAKMLPGSPEPPQFKQFYLEPEIRSVLANAAGIFKHRPDRGDEVKSGQVIGEIADLDGTVLAQLRAPCDAVVHEMMPRRLVYPGDLVYHLVVVSGPVVASTLPRDPSYVV